MQEKGQHDESELEQHQNLLVMEFRHKQLRTCKAYGKLGHAR